MTITDQIVKALLGERWAPLPTTASAEFWWAAPVYWISDQGRVALVTTDRNVSPGNRLTVKSLRGDHAGRYGTSHLRTALNVRKDAHAQIKGPRRRTVRVHRLVLAAWTTEPPGALVRHLNGDGRDNRLSNLAYGEVADNLRDQYALGEREPTNGTIKRRQEQRQEQDEQPGLFTEGWPDPDAHVGYVPDPEFGF